MSVDVLVNDFSILLKKFNDLVGSNPPVDKIKKELLEIKDSARNNNALNFRQKDSIVARVDNYIAGTYGKSKDGIKMLGEDKK